MAGRRTNLALLVVLAAALVTGVLAYALGTGWARWITVAHGLAGLAAVVLAPWKTVVARRGLRRRSGRAWPSLVLGVLVVVAVAAGLAHATGTAVSWGPVTAMQVHVGAALVAIPFALWHVLARPVGLRPTDLSRRNVLRAAAVVGGGAAVYGGLEGTVRLLSLPGADRRFTGSHERGSGDPSRMPVTQWLNDSVPAVDADRWLLRTSWPGGGRVWRYDDLGPFRQRRDAVLDCTGGWFAWQEWEGVSVDQLVPLDAGRSIAVRSVTGYQRRFPISDGARLLVATRCAGRELSPGHGFPARLVAPGRRGFWWVKWLESISVDDRPWWWQPPFPVS